jgi:predicted nucleotidyltransferase component of viral defense system
MELLLRVLPSALKDERMALKGGTAVNLFYRDLPRISVDIDLVYLPLEERAETFNHIHQILRKMAEKIEQLLPGSKVHPSFGLDGKRESKLFVRFKGSEVKIEPNYILRGTVMPVQEREICPRVKELFRVGTVVRCVSFEDLYGGKICAALDRQHARDLFDVKFLLDNEGITSDIRGAFIFCLLSGNRPPEELLNPHRLSLDHSYNEEFRGLHEGNISRQELEQRRFDKRCQQHHFRKR